MFVFIFAQKLKWQRIFYPFIDSDWREHRICVNNYQLLLVLANRMPKIQLNSPMFFVVVELNIISILFVYFVTNDEWKALPAGTWEYTNHLSIQCIQTRYESFLSSLADTDDWTITANCFALLSLSRNICMISLILIGTSLSIQPHTMTTHCAVIAQRANFVE